MISNAMATNSNTTTVCHRAGFLFAVDFCSMVDGFCWQSRCATLLPDFSFCRGFRQEVASYLQFYTVAAVTMVTFTHTRLKP